MIRVAAAVIVLPVVALVVYLSLGASESRSDFVLAAEEPRTLDPQRVSWMSEIQVASAMFEGLTRLNAGTLQPEPAVAEHWQSDAAQTRFTFRLRSNAKWSNGAPVTSEQFRYAWLRALDPHTEVQYASLLFVLQGGEAYYRSRLNDDPGDDLPGAAVGVTAPDEQTLIVTLERPCPYFLELAAFITFVPLYPPALERWSDAQGASARRTRHLWMRPGSAVCNGAFELVGWDFKKSIRLGRNPHYWDAASIAINSIEVSIVADPNVALLAYETGRIDLLTRLTTSTARALLAEQQAGRRPDLHVGDRFATYFFRVNCRRAPLDNPALRQALSLAIDREALCESVMGLGETPAWTYVPRSALQLMSRVGADGRATTYEPPTVRGERLAYAERAAAARECLRASNFGRIAATRPIELSYAPHPDYQRVAEAVQAMWESVLGIRVELRVIEGKVFSERIRNLDYDVARSDWFGDYMDPGTFLDMFTAASGQNRTGWANNQYDQLIAAAAGSADPERRFALFSQAERLLCEDELPIIPLFFRRGSWLLSPRFEGLSDNPREILPIQRVRRAR